MKSLFRNKNKDVKVERYTERPDFAWQMLRVKQSKKKVTPMPLDTPIFEDQIRFVCISDTHNRTTKWSIPLPEGDVLLHSGDFTQWGRSQEVYQFDKFMETLPHKVKLVIAGNHDLCLDTSLPDRQRDDSLFALYKVSTPRELLRHCCYLQDSFVTIGGYKIYGAPWTPEFYSMGFNFVRGAQALKKWNMIPEDADVVMTHGPPLGYGDKTRGNQHVGCAELLNTLQRRVKPRYLVCGHIHESNGVRTDGVTTFINSAICDRRYQPSQSSYIFDLPVPDGLSKSDILSAPLYPQSCAGDDDLNKDMAALALK